MASMIIEALACGLPIVTTRVGGNAELVENSVNGLLVAASEPQALQNARLDVLQRKWDRMSISKNMVGRFWHATASQIVHEWKASIDAETIQKSRNLGLRGRDSQVAAWLMRGSRA